jgi:hypothetical protein
VEEGLRGWSRGEAGKKARICTNPVVTISWFYGVGGYNERSVGWEKELDLEFSK